MIITIEVLPERPPSLWVDGAYYAAAEIRVSANSKGQAEVSFAVDGSAGLLPPASSPPVHASLPEPSSTGAYL